MSTEGAPRSHRRRFLTTTAGALAAAGTVPYWFSSPARAFELRAKNNRPLLGAIGVGGQGSGIGNWAREFGDMVAVCDVQRQHAERFNENAGGKLEIFADYRRLLERKDIEAVTIGTPDHWHTAICLAALEAGKHVYCEKPLTLTVHEGQLLVDAVRRSGKTMQVGTQQRGSQPDLFARAVATVRLGLLGKLQQVTVNLPLSTSTGGPFPGQPVPEGLDWDRWLGQAPSADFAPERCHFQFRWWYEYSGGICTDWGAHHMDVTHWALDCETSGPLEVDGSATKLPDIPGGYNTPRLVTVDYLYPGDVRVRMQAQEPGDEGVLFQGEKGRIYVNRGRLTGKPIEEQDADPALRARVDAQVKALFKDNADTIGNHMKNFFEAFMFGKHPVSDVVSQHRTVSACHLGNISIRLGRKLTWDAGAEKFLGDDEANGMLSRPQREPYQFG